MIFVLFLRHRGALVRILTYFEVQDALDNGRAWLASGGQGFHIEVL